MLLAVEGGGEKVLGSSVFIAGSGGVGAGCLCIGELRGLQLFERALCAPCERTIPFSFSFLI